MSAGISESLDVLIGMIRGLAPKTDPYHSYVIDEDGSGTVIKLEDREASQQPRVADLRFRPGGLPGDDGEAGLTSRRMRAGLVLRVQYPDGGDAGHWTRIIAEDVAQLSLKLPMAYAESGAVAAGLQSIPPPGQASVQNITDSDGAPVARRVSIPFDMIYLEA